MYRNVLFIVNISVMNIVVVRRGSGGEKKEREGNGGGVLNSIGKVSVK